MNSTLAAVPAAAQAVQRVYADADLWSLLDDRLQQDVDAQDGRISDAHRRRVRRLIDNAVDGGADAVLLTCSIFGDVAEAANAVLPVPVLAADGAALDAIVEARPATVAVLASLPGPLREISGLLQDRLDGAGVGTRLLPSVVEGAAAAARTGDTAQVAALLRADTESLPERPEMVFLAQYSIASARRSLQDALGVPVMAGPDSAVRALQTTLPRR